MDRDTDDLLPWNWKSQPYYYSSKIGRQYAVGRGLTKEASGIGESLAEPETLVHPLKGDLGGRFIFSSFGSCSFYFIKCCSEIQELSANHEEIVGIERILATGGF